MLDSEHGSRIRANFATLPSSGIVARMFIGRFFEHQVGTSLWVVAVCLRWAGERANSPRVEATPRCWQEYERLRLALREILPGLGVSRTLSLVRLKKVAGILPRNLKLSLIRFSSLDGRFSLYAILSAHTAARADIQTKESRPGRTRREEICHLPELSRSLVGFRHRRFLGH